MIVKLLQEATAAKRGKVNPQVYFDVKIGNKMSGRIIMQLRADVVPMTAGDLSCCLLNDEKERDLFLIIIY